MSDMSGGSGVKARENPNLFGHEFAERIMIEAYASGRLPHAWLLSGSKGIGKATLAYRFARYLFSGAGVGLFGTPDDLHLPEDDPLFRRVALGTEPGLRTVARSVDPKNRRERADFKTEADWEEYQHKNRRTEIVVQDVRELGDFFHMTVGEGAWRIAIVDAADEMNRNAANALLKVLEEPPRNAVLLLIAHRPALLLPTIRSRCRKLVMSPLADDAVAQVLSRARPNLEDAEVRALSRLGEGSPGRALALEAAGGLDLYREMIAVLDGLPQLDVKALVALSERAGRRGGDDTFETVTHLLRWWLARLIRGRVLRRAPEEVVPGEGALTVRLSAIGDLDRWLDVWDKTNRLVGRALGANLDRKQVVMNAFLALEGAARV
jgi:DNA polymerase-3 subunit delta'